MNALNEVNHQPVENVSVEVNELEVRNVPEIETQEKTEGDFMAAEEEEEE